MVDAYTHLLTQRQEIPALFRTVFAALLQEVQTLRQREQAQRVALQRLQDQVRSAAELQQDLLPARLPSVRGLQIHTLYRPAETVSGDLYDIVRLDAHRVAFTLADATGHGLPAGMLSALAHRSLAGKHAVHPAQVLEQANQDVLDLQLPDCQFVGAVYAVFDEMSRELTWARGGLPYPILVRDGCARQVSSTGPALGAVEAASFELVRLILRPGDRVLFHTDGVDAVLCHSPSSPKGEGPGERVAPSPSKAEGARGGSPKGWGEGKAPRLCHDLTQTGWFAQLARRELARQLPDLDDCLAAARRAFHEIDDLTVVALQAE